MLHIVRLWRRDLNILPREKELKDIFLLFKKGTDKRLPLSLPFDRDLVLRYFCFANFLLRTNFIVKKNGGIGWSLCWQLSHVSWQ